MAAKSQSFEHKIGAEKFQEYLKFLATIPVGTSYSECAKQVKAALGIDVKRTTLGGHLSLVESLPGNPSRPVKEPEQFSTADMREDSGTLESLSGEVRTVDDALAKAQVDMNIWEVERCVVNHYEMGAKLPDGALVTTPLWQVKVWLRKRRGWSREEFKALLIKDISAIAPPRPVEVVMAPEYDTLLAELSIFDAHFGKLAWAPESGADYDLNICRSRYTAAADDLLARASVRNPERVLYVVGNDFFHTDQGDKTTRGTDVDTDGRWQKSFRIGTKCVIETIDKALRIAGYVDVLVVPGNHDAQKSFMLGDLVGAYYRNDGRVTVINEPSPFVYYRYGTNLLGFNHGDETAQITKRQMLPATMATDRPQDWAETTTREFHLGHVHHESEHVWKYRNSDSVRELVVRTLPSISSTDAWHRACNYKSVLAAECHYYHRTKGRYGYDVYTVQE